MTASEGVITPELFGRGLCSPEGLAVLRAWKDGALRPVVCRNLLKRYLGVLKRLGVVDPQSLRAWVWTWSDRESVTWIEDPVPESSPGRALCQALATKQSCALLVWMADDPGARDLPLVVPAAGLSDWLAL